MDRKRQPVSSGLNNLKKVHPGKQRSSKKHWKVALLIAIAFFCAATGIIGGTVLAYIKTASPITADQLKLNDYKTYVYDINKNVVGELSQNENREWVKYDQVPENMKDAFVSIEDERFFDHDGVDVIGLFRAVFFKLTHPTRPMPGASTITMQVVKNITGEDQRLLQRKIQEQWRAMQLEKKLTKWEILQLYMNVITTGPGISGVQSAAKTYFNKNVSELSLAQCALIAGITNYPARYNPFTTKGRENTKSRQLDVLAKMKELGKISPEEYEQAVNEPIVYYEGDPKQTKKTSKQSYFVDQVVLDVKWDLVAQGMTESMALNLIYNGGLKIYTTMDLNVQNAIDEVFQNSSNFPVSDPGNQHPQAAMVIMDPQNGYVRGMYGGYGEKLSNTLNRATQIERQPGSSIKPIAIYGPALNEQLITAATIVDDAPVYMLGEEKGPYPNNYDFTYKGLINIRDAVMQSLNVVAAKVWKDYLGPDLPLEYLKKVGINRDQREASLALGGLAEGVSPYQMAAAYVPFVNRGMYYTPSTFTKVEDQFGEVIIEKKVSKPTMVYDEPAAYIMNTILQDVVSWGTASGYSVNNANGETIPTGGKTGTTGDNIDKWFVGFTPYYTAATWYGYDSNIQIPSGEYSQALNLWFKVMDKVHSSLAYKEFNKPSGLVNKYIDMRSGKIPTQLSEQDPLNIAEGIPYAPVREELFIKGTEPDDNDFDNVHLLKKVCTESKDYYGRYMLAGPYCPASSVVEKVFIHRPVPYEPANSEVALPADFIYDYSPYTCAVHTSASKSSSSNDKAKSGESLLNKLGDILTNKKD